MRTLSIVMYHYVRDLKNSKYPEIRGLDKELFIKQIQYIKKNYTTITMEELMQACAKGDYSKLPERAMLLTFDDGYIDHYDVVYPILKEYGMQGSFFPNAMAVKEHKLLTVNRIHFILAVACAKEGGIQQLVEDCFKEIENYRAQGVELSPPEEIFDKIAVANRWDPKEVIFIKRLLQNELPEEIRTEIAKKLFVAYVGETEEEFAKKLYMNKEQIKEMKEGGMFFGLHGYDHYWLSKLPKEQMRQDIDKALDYFSDVLDRECWVMNYPYGDYSRDVIDYIKNIGCALGLTVEARNVDMDKDDLYILPRWDTNDLPPKGNAK